MSEQFPEYSKRWWLPPTGMTGTALPHRGKREKP
jgi:hypothetical protein